MTSTQPPFFKHLNLISVEIVRSLLGQYVLPHALPQQFRPVHDRTEHIAYVYEVEDTGLENPVEFDVVNLERQIGRNPFGSIRKFGHRLD